MYHIIKRINQSNGPVMVYSRFKGVYGIKLLSEALKQNGYENYDENGNKTGKDLKNKKGTFITWTSDNRIDKSKELFNSFENKNGELIKVFLMTSSGKEGINLFSIRQIHLLEPWWNNNIPKQVIARGIRMCSHDHIPESDFIDYNYFLDLNLCKENICIKMK